MALSERTIKGQLLGTGKQRMEVSNNRQEVNKGAAGGLDIPGSPAGAFAPTESRTWQDRAEGAGWLC